MANLPPTSSRKNSNKKSIKFSPLINDRYKKESFKSELHNSFVNKKLINGDHGKATLHVDPFSVCVLQDFITPESFLESLREELADQIFYEKNNDLYKFQQTDDLKKISTPYVKEIRNFLQQEVHKWLSEITGYELKANVDSTCSRYDYKDVLLCHDDELYHRRIAYVLYLVPNWKNEDGGCLDLFNMDEHLQPKDIVKSIVPAFNQFVWFEVTEASYHQVSEVLCQCKSRLSINGWFHALPESRLPRYVEPRASLHSWTIMEEDAFYSWINPIYLDPEVQGQIQEKFESDSEIELQGFIQEEKYQALVQALKNTDLNWKDIGPPNKRKYKSLKCSPESSADPPSEDGSSVPGIIQDCLKFFHSEMLFLTLSNLTGLTLHPMVSNSDSDSESDAGEGHEGCSSHDGKESVVDNDNEGANGSSHDGKESVVNNDNEGANGSSHDGKESVVNNDNEGANGSSHNGKESVIDNDNEGANEIKDDKNSQQIKRRKLDKVDKQTGESSEAKTCDPTCTGEIRKWQHGDYTLIHDTHIDGMQFALDAMLYCSCKGWEETYGGFTSYITKGEDEELLTVVPSENSLALVYRDKETLRFVKHINASVEEDTKLDTKGFFDINFVYYE